MHAGFLTFGPSGKIDLRQPIGTRTMTIDLSPENQSYIDQTVASGLFHDREHALNAAVDLLKRRERLIRDVNSGIEQLEKGQGEPFDVEAMMAEIDEQLREQKK
jgi:Arc/MetJ-type ribon-helix-helix transcriptional regulator